MPNTFAQLNVMLVFAVKYRNTLLTPDLNIKLNKYITGIVENCNQRLVAINGVSDHIHILVNYKPDLRISDLVRTIKSNSSKYINEHNWFVGKFHWQVGYGAFSYSNSQLKDVVNYIANQQEHHKVRSFKKEYVELLYEFGIKYEEKYLFDF